MATVRVTEILEADSEAILFGGVVEGGERDGELIAFHVPIDKGGTEMADAFEREDVVYAELPI